LGLSSNFNNSKLSDDLIIALYDEGRNDREIAEELGVTAAAINYRREKLGLLSNSKQVDMEQFSSLFYAGFPIENIAHTMRISMSKALDSREELLWKRRPSHVYSKEEGM
jgi:Zn-dependent peptidase ImmA (M78 family)